LEWVRKRDGNMPIVTPDEPKVNTGWSQARRSETSGSAIENGVSIVLASDDQDASTDMT